MMQNAAFRVGRNAAALFAARVVVLLLGVWLNGQITRTVGVAGLGRYLLALTVEGITLAIVNAGLNLYATREFARDDPDTTATRLGVVLVLKALAALLGMALLNGIIAPLFFEGARQKLIAVASLGLLPQALNGGMEALLRGRQRMDLTGLIEVLARLVGVLAGLIWLSSGGDERHVLASAVGGHLFGSAAYARVLWAHRAVPRLRGWHDHARAALREALPFAGADIVAMLYRRADVLLLSAWHGDVAVGIYGAAYRLWETLGLLPASFLDALFPELVRRAVHTTDHSRILRLYLHGALALVVLVVVIAAPSFWLAPRLMQLLYGDAIGLDISVRVFRVLILVLPCTYLYLLNGHLLYAVGQQRRVLAAMALVTLSSILLNVSLIPRWNYWGALATALFAEIALLALLTSTAWKRVLQKAPVSGGAA